MQRLRSSVSDMVFPALVGPDTARLLALEFQLERSQWLPPQALLGEQLRQLRIVLDHAAQTVPYYRELFAERGWTVPAELTPESFRNVPASARHAIANAGERLRSERLPAGHGRTRDVVTSGSTGQPVHMLSTELADFFGLALNLREYLWHGRDFSRKQGAIRWHPKDVARAPEGARFTNWGRGVHPFYESGPACVLNVATPLAQQVAWLERERPDYLISFPSNLEALARHCLEHRSELRFLEVRTVGETVSAVQRALYAQAWGCKVVDMYTCEEAGYLALQCPIHDHYHVQSENVLLEIVDEAGRPCAPGRPGRVLITALHNFATPLVRYELGDYAAFGEPCGCGRGLPTLARVYGRTRSRVVYPDGRSEFPYLGEHGQVRDLTGVEPRAFQFIQRSVEEIELRLVVEREFTAEETLKVARHFQETFGHPFRITITYWDEIPKSGRGKFEEFVCEVAS